MHNFTLGVRLEFPIELREAPALGTRVFFETDDIHAWQSCRRLRKISVAVNFDKFINLGLLLIVRHLALMSAAGVDLTSAANFIDCCMCFHVLANLMRVVVSVRSDTRGALLTSAPPRPTNFSHPRHRYVDVRRCHAHNPPRAPAVLFQFTSTIKPITDR